MVPLLVCKWKAYNLQGYKMFSVNIENLQNNVSCGNSSSNFILKLVGLRKSNAVELSMMQNGVFLQIQLLTVATRI